jgi:diacylglycerol kinase (ATP)
MKKIHLFHNPSAGDEEHSAGYIIRCLERFGYNVTYRSTKDPFTPVAPDADIILIAGGDGTVRKVIEFLLYEQPPLPHQLVTLLPFGTANNVALTLQIEGSVESIIGSWQKDKIQLVQTGSVTYGAERNFFIESGGFGLFPFHIAQAKKNKLPESATAQERIEHDHHNIVESIRKVAPVHYDIDIDGRKISGAYIMAEVMNMQAFGSNFVFSPGSNPHDDYFELLLATEHERLKLIDFINARREDDDTDQTFQIIKGKEIRISNAFSALHVDDEIINIDREHSVTFSSKAPAFRFLLP